MRMRTTPILALVITLLMVVTACSWTDSESSPESTFVPGNGTPTLVGTPVVFTDPRELAAYFARQAEAGDWPALQPLLAEGYQGFGYGIGQPFDHYFPIVHAGTTVGTQPEEWNVEESGSLVVTRLRGDVPLPLVMRRLPDDTLRLDPGPCALQTAAYWRNRPNEDRGGFSTPGYQKQYLGDDALLLAIHRGFQDEHGCVAYADGTVTVTSLWWFRRGASGVIAISGLSWSAGDQHGRVQVVWTDAVMGDESIEFPPAPRTDAATAYSISLQLFGVPYGEDLHLHVDGMTLHNATSGEEIVFSIDYRLSGSPYPDPAAPEPVPTNPPPTTDLTDP